MEKHQYGMDYNDRLLAELYDQCITYDEDVKLLQRLLAGKEQQSILEIFSGTGRILVQLLLSGHRVTGLEMAGAMVAQAVKNIQRHAPGLLGEAAFKVQDATKRDWGSDYDVVVMGGNGLYELASARDQERCIELASGALKTGGLLFIDNDNWRTPLSSANIGDSWTAMEGVVPDGSYCRLSAAVTGVDLESQVMHIRRTWHVKTAEGVESSTQYMSSKRPFGYQEASNWLNRHGFVTLAMFGDREGSVFTAESPRAIFWAQKA